MKGTHYSLIVFLQLFVRCKKTESAAACLTKAVGCDQNDLLLDSDLYEFAP